MRLQAIAAIGRLGETVDEAGLVEMLRDAQWWVRYRAAQTLTSFRSADSGHLREILRVEKDKFAREILCQAASEKGMSL